MNGRSFTIVGVTPPRFNFPVASPPPQIWVTVAEDARVETPADTPMTEQRGAHFVQVIGRMQPGVDLTNVQAEFGSLVAALAQANPEDHRYKGSMVSLQHDAIVGNARQPLLLLLAAVSCVLLIACVNLANLMTARGVTRQPELALRVALGASRSRVVRLLLAESLALAIVSAIGGILIAWWSLDVLVGLAPRDVHGLRDVSNRQGRVGLHRVDRRRVLAAGGAGAGAAGDRRRLAPRHGRRSHVRRVAFRAPLAQWIDRRRNGGRRGAAGRGHAGRDRSRIVSHMSIQDSTRPPSRRCVSTCQTAGIVPSPNRWPSTIACCLRSRGCPASKARRLLVRCR